MPAPDGWIPSQPGSGRRGWAWLSKLTVRDPNVPNRSSLPVTRVTRFPLRFFSAGGIPKIRLTHLSALNRVNGVHSSACEMPVREGFSLRTAPRPLRWLLGLIPAALSLLIIYLLPVDYRMPYLITFPIVVFCAWYLGIGAGIICAVVSGFGVEGFIRYAHVVPHASFVASSPLRLLTFVFCCMLVGGLMRQSSILRQRAELEGLRLQLERVAEERALAHERSIAAAAVRERESRLQMALEGGHVGLWDNDFERGTVSWSDEHYRILGFEPGSVPACFETIQACTHPEDREPMVALFNEARLAGRSFYCEYRVTWPDGSIHWVESQAKYELNAQGKAIRMLGVITDVTHRKQAEIALLRTEKLAAAGRLAASIAHEINNPLEAVANLLYLIENADSLDQAREQAEIAMTEVMRISRITQQTLKFHRQSESPRVMRLSEVINDVLELFQGRLALSHINIDRRYKDDPEIEFLAGDLRQVFANLIVNALDAMSDHGGTLTICLKRSHDWRSRQNSGLRVTLLDTGCGMDRATRRRIYEPFFTTKKDTGTGLGLWITADIIDRQHGDLRVWSRQIPGRSGTAFSLFLPLRDAKLGVVSVASPEKTLAGNAA